MLTHQINRGVNVDTVFFGGASTNLQQRYLDQHEQQK